MTKANTLHNAAFTIARGTTDRVGYRNNEVVIIENVAGQLAGDRIHVKGEMQAVIGKPTGAFRFAADRMDLQTLATIFNSTYAKNYSGLVTYRGNIQFGREIFIFGNSHLKNGLVYDLPIQDVRNDLTINLSTIGALKEVSARKIHGTAVGGHFDGEAYIRGGTKYSLDANGKIGDGKLEQLSRALGFESVIGTGNFDAVARWHD